MTAPSMSDTITKLASALAKAQPMFGGAKKVGKNDFIGYKFATLEAVIQAIREPLNSNGITYLQFPVSQGDGIGLTTMLMHESGEWLATTMALAIDTAKGRTDVQAAGSTITYMRRYALMAMCGIPTEDDDGNSAGPRREEPQRRSTPRNGNSSKPVSNAQTKMFHTLVDKLRLTENEVASGIKRYVGYEARFSELPSGDASKVLDALQAKTDEL